MSAVLAPTLDVPEYGRSFLGIGRDAAYAAAARGDFPVIRIGRTLRVPTYAGLKHLGWPDSAIARALGLEPDSTNDELTTSSPSASIHVLATKTGDPQYANDDPA